MLEFIVLGEVPGTQKQLNDVTVISILASIIVLLLGYALYRAHIASAIRQKQYANQTPNSDIELIAL